MSDDLKRFMSHVDKAGPDGCWIWTAGCDGKGYGLFHVGSRTDGTNRKVLSHRFAYEAFVGDPTDQCVCHHCDNPPCVNPEHLFNGSLSDNSVDMVAKGRHKAPRKLSEADHRAIAASSDSSKALAERYGVHYTHINWIRRKFRNHEVEAAQVID